MVSFVQFFVIAAVLAVACGETLNVTSSAQDFFLISQRELLHDIAILDVEIAAVDARFADRLDTVQLQQQRLLLEIQQVNKTLMPLQALGLVRKHCIQKYDSQLMTYEKAQELLKYCYNQAASIATSLTSSARSNSYNAKNQVNSLLPKSVASCDYSYSKNQTALDLCYINAVDSTKNNVDFYITTARTQLEKNLFDSAVTARTAVQCSFLVERDSLETIGTTSKLIDDCEKSVTFQSAALPNNVEENSLQKLLLGTIKKQQIVNVEN